MLQQTRDKLHVQYTRDAISFLVYLVQRLFAFRSASARGRQRGATWAFMDNGKKEN